MSGSSAASRLAERLAAAFGEHGVGAADVDALASQLVWRIGRTSDDGPITVRVGFATSASLFAELPRLRNATDAEIEAALGDDAFRVEWIGPRPA